MGKNDFLTPKAIANRIKAKGLQKLRWYCQLCQKQCRDENGFKCHCMSEGHQRQMQVFGENPDRFMDGYSEEFERDFLEHFRRSHRFSRVAATVLYNEYINDRHHIHMNSTKWTTLTDFVKYLGRKGICKVDETPKGWFMTLTDKEPEELIKENLKAKRVRAELAEGERNERALEQQVERAQKLAKPAETVEVKELQRPEGEETKIVFGLGSGAKKEAAPPKPPKPPFFGDADSARDGPSTSGRSNGNTVKEAVGGTLAALMEDAEKAKERANRKDFWLVPGIVVKVMSKALKEKGYYKRKGVVEKVISKYVGEIRLLDEDVVLRVDQAELETVLPQIGGLVRVVNGAYRGEKATLLGVDTDKFTARVRLEKGHYDGRVLQAVEYEDICKSANS